MTFEIASFLYFTFLIFPRLLFSFWNGVIVGLSRTLSCFLSRCSIQFLAIFRSLQTASDLHSHATEHSPPFSSDGRGVIRFLYRSQCPHDFRKAWCIYLTVLNSSIWTFLISYFRGTPQLLNHLVPGRHLERHNWCTKPAVTRPVPRQCPRAHSWHLALRR